MILNFLFSDLVQHFVDDFQDIEPVKEDGRSRQIFLLAFYEGRRHIAGHLLVLLRIGIMFLYVVTEALENLLNPSFGRIQRHVFFHIHIEAHIVVPLAGGQLMHANTCHRMLQFVSNNMMPIIIIVNATP
jgi:hypothetical protein